MDDDWQETFKRIKQKHDEIFFIIDRAVRFEENELPDSAATEYKNGIKIIDEVMVIPVGVPEVMTDDTWDQACKMIHKLKRTRAEVLMRISQISNDSVDGNKEKEIIDSSIDSQAGGDAGYKWKHYQPESNSRPRTYTELANALREMDCNRNAEATESNTSQLELLFSCSGVQLYHINPNGNVTTTSDDSLLRIVRIGGDDKRNLATTIFLQVIKSAAATKIKNVESSSSLEDFEVITEEKETVEEATCSDSATSTTSNDVSWIYPLVPGASPCYRTEYNAFILPDLQSEEPGAAIGLVVPQGADEVVLEILEELLHGVVKQTDATKPNLSTTVSKNIVKGAYYVSQGLVHGANKAGEWMSYGTPVLISKITSKPEDKVEVPSNVRTGIEIAKSVTGAAASFTGFIAGKVGVATMSLGKFLAPHIQKQGSRLLSHGLGISADEASERVSDALTIAAGAVEGFGTIYSGLDESAGILGKNLSNNTVKIIEHKYGENAGSVAGTTFDTVGNVINFSKTVGVITPKTFVKNTAKGAGKGIVEEYRSKKSGSIVPAGALYPDLSGLAKEINRTTKDI